MHKTVQDILNMKKEKKKISVITSYDYTLASLCDKAGIDVLLVGDSAGMVMLGYENTISVTMDQMCMFTEAVSRARKNSLTGIRFTIHVIPSQVLKMLSIILAD